MAARVLRVDSNHPDPAAIAEAAAVLRQGRLVAFPTETVYGLGANARDESAVRRIFEAKGRPAENPLIVHVADAAAARALARDWPPQADRLAAAFWPGPLTAVVRKRADVPDIITAGLDTVAVRVPAHPVALALITAAELPVAAPSANPSGAVSPTTAEHVRRALGDRVDLILDGGATQIGIESTVVDLTGERPLVLRPGMISAEAVEDVIGPVDRLRQPSPSAETGDARGEVPSSPGLLGRHYAPRAELRVFTARAREQAAETLREAKRRGRRVGMVAFEPLDAAADRTVRMPRDATTYAKRLYGTLHDLDEDGCDIVFIEEVPDAPQWTAIRDRIRRAHSSG